MEQPQVFFGYASTPELSREALFDASAAVSSTGLVEGVSWESLRVGGRLIIDRIFDAIDSAELSAFDVSTLNENVLFELGYAIGRGRRIWILLDKTDAEAKAHWRQFRLLSTVGYQGWSNSDDIRTAFLRDQPHLAESTLYDDIIEPNLNGQVEGALFYLPSFHVTEASKRLGRRLDIESRRGVRLISADPTESALNPIAWYAQKVYETAGSVAHFMAHRRELAWLHNARAALVSGLAAGFERPLLMLAEEDYSEPLDYRDLLRHYRSGNECQEIASTWLKGLPLEPQGHTGGRRLRLVTELRGLRFGEHVAENESDVLSEYFVETAAFDEVMSSRNTLFVGRKGAGKTANMMQAAARLREDARNLVIVIKPQSYELEGLVALLPRLPRDVKTYTVLSLWSFLLQSEIARAAVQTVELRPGGVPMTEAERTLVAFVHDTDFGLREEFSVRFERTVAAIEGSGLADASTIGEGRDLLNEGLHSEAISKLRTLIGPVLRGRNRVAILIDNLDKAWDREADLDAVTQLLLGLMAAIGRVTVEYEKEDFWRDRVSLSLATFLRSDIYAHLQRAAREPDKIPTSRLSWSDPRQLRRVVEERFLAARPESTPASELWTRFFCSEVAGMPLSEYLAWRVLPRPRDIVYMCNAATIAAVDARRERVEEEDFLLAEQNYSQFAYEALLVENGITISAFEDVLLEFAGADAMVSQSEALEAIGKALQNSGEEDEVLARLKAVSFLGLEISEGRCIFPEVGAESKRAEVLARKYADSRGSEVRLTIHPAYRPYLEIREPAEQRNWWDRESNQG
jgi:hypothetical protein